MGRKKPGKPRRPRKPREYTLQELQPPGEGYDQWFQVNPKMDASQINDPRIDGDALALMETLSRLAPLYDSRIPKAAVYLDSLIDSGHIPISRGEDDWALVPLEEMPTALRSAGQDTIRESLHTLHAAGALLVFTDEEHDLPFVRIVIKRPQEPGQSWHFDGDTGVPVRNVCIPNGIWDDLPIAVADAVGFMRACQVNLKEPDPEVYGTHKGVNGTQHARELFAAALASGYVDEKGCEACPAGHLCTRNDPEGEL